MRRRLIQRHIARILVERNDPIRASDLLQGLVEKVGDSFAGFDPEPHLGEMITMHMAEVVTDATSGEALYRLTERGRIRFFGTRREKLKEYWLSYGLEAVLDATEAMFGLLTALLRD